MKTIFKWLLRFLFVIAPTIFLGFLFVYNTIDNISKFNFNIIDVLLPDWAVCVCFWLPFTLIGIAIILRWFNVTEKALRIIICVSGVLLLPYIVVQYQELIRHLTYSAPQFLPENYILKGSVAFFTAIFCFLPDKLFKIKWIPLILSILAICAPNSYRISKLYWTSASIPTIRYIINDIATNIIPYVSILLCAQLMREKKI